jgi:hypothetical protein
MEDKTFNTSERICDRGTGGDQAAAQDQVVRFPQMSSSKSVAAVAMAILQR